MLPRMLLSAAAAAAAAAPDLGVTYRLMGAGGLSGCDDGGLGASGASNAAECQRPVLAVGDPLPL